MFKFAKKTMTSIASQIDDDSDEARKSSLEDNSPQAVEAREHQGLEDQILNLWKKVWFGLYQVHDRHGPYHINQLRKLYLGAGMATHLAKQELEDGSSSKRTKSTMAHPLGLLSLALADSSRTFSSNSGIANGIQDLRLYDNLSIATLRSVLELLSAYESQIASLNEVYGVLQELQVDLSRIPTSEDVEVVLARYPAIADPIAEHILHYNARLTVMVMDMENESTVRYNHLQRKEDIDNLGKVRPPVAWYVQDRALPRPGKRGFLSGSMASDLY